MKIFSKTIVALLVILSHINLLGQETGYVYEPSSTHPFGLPNPEAPQEIKGYAPLMKFI